MIRSLTFLLMLVATRLSGQTASVPDSLQTDSLHVAYCTYFNSCGLNFDSAASTELYRTVYEWKGTRYQYAGRSRQGVDCSGFVCAVYDTVYHIRLTGGSKDLYTQVDTVPRDSLQEGDILFFKIRKGQISHVGIYLGNDRFAHASVHSGVTVSNLNDEYYRKYYFTGGRVTRR